MDKSNDRECTVKMTERSSDVDDSGINKWKIQIPKLDSLFKIKSTVKRVRIWPFDVLTQNWTVIWKESTPSFLILKIINCAKPFPRFFSKLFTHFPLSSWNFRLRSWNTDAYGQYVVTLSKTIISVSFCRISIFYSELIPN